jgi:ketosteroid isomerase-like protein
MIEDMSDFRALDPFFRAIERGLAGFVYGGHFFDLLAQDVVFDFIITVPNYPGHIVGRADLIELYRGYGSTFFLDRCYDLRVHHTPSTSSVVLEYYSEGRAVATGQPYNNRYISGVVIKDRKVTAWRDYLDHCGSSPPSRDARSNRTPEKRRDDQPPTSFAAIRSER